MENQLAVAAGVADAETWISETTDPDMWQLAISQPLGADEALINAMGSDFVAKLFGVENDTDAYASACGDYSKAWRETVREALAECEAFL